MKQPDGWQVGILDLGNGHQVQAAFQNIGNKEWRSTIAIYERKNGLPVSVYTEDLKPGE